jgi:mannose/cellobiose epimerase-like protein (N-acyl-D-glucosamine 2-epimerase family)
MKSSALLSLLLSIFLSSAAHGEAQGIENLPTAEQWKEHIDLLKKYWIHPDALGNPVGYFPTWRCNDGSLRHADSPCPDEADVPGWMKENIGYDYTRMISRQTFAYGALFNLTGDPELLKYHLAGVRFLMNRASDPRGGFYSRFSGGNTLEDDEPECRTAQDLSYALVGLAMNAYLTGDKKVIDTIIKTKRLIYGKYYDRKNGILRWVLKDTCNESPSRQELVAQLDQINAYLLLAWRLVPADVRKEWSDTLKQTAEMMNSHFYRADKNDFLGCTDHESCADPETGRHLDYGHRIKAFWMEYLIAIGLNDDRLKRFAKNGMKETLDLALQKDQKNWFQSQKGDDAQWWVFAELDQAALTLALTDDFPIPQTLKTILGKYTDRKNGELKFGTKTHLWRNGFHSTEHALIGSVLSEILRNGNSGSGTVLYFAPAEPEKMIYTPYLFGGDVGGIIYRSGIAEVHFSNVTLPRNLN